MAVAVVKAPLHPAWSECDVYADNTSQVCANVAGNLYKGRAHNKTELINIPPQFFLLGASHAHSKLKLQVWYDVQSGKVGETFGASDWYGKGLMREALQAHWPQLMLHQHVMRQLYGQARCPAGSAQHATLTQDAAQLSWDIVQSLRACAATKLVGDMSVVVERSQSQQARVALLAIQQKRLERQLSRAHIQQVVMYFRGAHGAEEFALDDDDILSDQTKAALASELREFCRAHLATHRPLWSQGQGARGLFRFDLKTVEPQGSCLVRHHFVRAHEKSLLPESLVQRMDAVFEADQDLQRAGCGLSPCTRRKSRPVRNTSGFFPLPLTFNWPGLLS